MVNLNRSIAGVLASWIVMMTVGSCADVDAAGEAASNYFKSPADLALAEAGAVGDLAGMDASVSDGADVNANRTDGITMFFWIYGTKNKAAFKRLYELGADPLQEAKNGRTVAFFAVRDDDPDYLAILLEGGLDPDATDAGGDTLLMEAAGGRH